MVRRTLIKSIALACVLSATAYADESDEDAPIPTTMEEAFAALDAMLSEQDKEQIRSDEECEMIRLHFGLGMWMRNNWGLWQGSALADLLTEKGIHHPDDMSGVILASYWRYLNDLPIELTAQAERIQRTYETGVIEDYCEINSDDD
ncbi:MAG: DUF6794 domain-containing protein [Pseudomonadota bacterium]